MTALLWALRFHECSYFVSVKFILNPAIQLGGETRPSAGSERRRSLHTTSVDSAPGRGSRREPCLAVAKHISLAMAVVVVAEGKYLDLLQSPECVFNLFISVVIGMIIVILYLFSKSFLFLNKHI